MTRREAVGTAHSHQTPPHPEELNEAVGNHILKPGSDIGFFEGSTFSRNYAGCTRSPAKRANR